MIDVTHFADAKQEGGPLRAIFARLCPKLLFERKRPAFMGPVRGVLCRNMAGLVRIVPFGREVRVNQPSIGAGQVMDFRHFLIAEFKIENIEIGLGIFG